MISDEYKKALRGLHESVPQWGNGPRGHILRICKWIYEERVEDLLDYGCGKGKNMPLMLPVRVTNYDPGVPQWEADPRACMHLMCLDVLEHIEPEYIEEVLAHIASKFKKSAMLSVSMTEAKDTLPDGRNAHLLLRPVSWWLEMLDKFFTLKQVEFQTNNIVVFVTPKQK